MASARTIQARDKDTVIEMYRAMDVRAFGIFAGNEPIFGKAPDSIEEGEQLLCQWLDWIDDSKSAAIYSLRVYRKITDDADITNKTPFNACINFRLHDLSQAIGGPGGNAGYFSEFTNTINGLRSEMKKINDRMDEKEEEEEEDGGIIGKLMNPGFIEQLPVIVGVIKGLFAGGGQAHDDHEIPPSGRISGITGTHIPAETDDQKIAMAIERLKIHLPDLPAVLTKLADMAEKKPGTFKSALMVIRSMKV